MRRGGFHADRDGAAHRVRVAPRVAAPAVAERSGRGVFEFLGTVPEGNGLVSRITGPLYLVHWMLDRIIPYVNLHSEPSDATAAKLDQTP